MNINNIDKSRVEDKKNNSTKKIVYNPFLFKLLIVDFTLLFFAYGGFYRSFFANSDTLWGVLDPSSTFKARLDCFRWLPAVVEAGINKTGFLPGLHYRLSLFIFLCTLAISLFLVQIVFLNLFKKSYPSQSDSRFFVTAIILAVSLSFINVLFTEFFYFTETYYVFGLAFLLMGSGFYLLSRNYFGMSFIFFLFMTMSYQMSCPIATICIGVYVYLENKGEFSLKLVKDELVKAMPPMMLFVLNYVTGPLIQKLLLQMGIESYQEKSPSFGYSIGEYITIVASSVNELVSSNLGLTPSVYAPLLVFGITFIVVVAVCIKNKKWNRLLTFFLVEVILFVLVFAVQLAENPESFIARTVSTLYFAQSMQLLIMFYVLADVNDNSILITNARKLLYLLPTIYIMFNVFFIQCIIENRLISETLDSVYAESIFNKISTYEKETGIIVNKIAPINDTDSSPFYEQVYFCRGAINRRCYSDYTWTFLQYCTYNTELAGELTGRNFERVAMDDEIYKEYFEGINWDGFDAKEQVVIRGDTAYICVF